jgi:hypothetical protein
MTKIEVLCGLEKISEIMISWPNKKSYVDWNLCDRKLPRSICITMWIRIDDIGWCHDLI